jgi:two-component system LytT family response regulator
MTEAPCTALIVDDEPLARALLREFLAPFPHVRVLGECADGFEAVRMAAEHKPDLLFLDIQMPGLDGFEVLELLEPRPEVVFVTAHDRHALRAFEVHAVDYLQKPFSEERFQEALRRARERLGQGRGGRPDPGALAAAARDGAPLARLAVKEGARITVIPLAKVDYIQAQDDYVLLSVEGRGRLKEVTLSSLEPRLDPARFLRIHRSCIVQLDRVARLEQGVSGSWEAVLADGARLPVSRSRLAVLRQVLNG